MQNLVRTTTYFDRKLFTLTKKMAIDEGKSFYEFMNEKLFEGLGRKINKPKLTPAKPFRYEEIFTVKPLKLRKKRLMRADAYE